MFLSVAAMSILPPDIDPEFWIAQVFSAKAVAAGGIIRRRTQDIDRITGRQRFLDEVHRRGFQAVENAGNIVVFCNQHPITALARRETIRGTDRPRIVPQFVQRFLAKIV